MKDLLADEVQFRICVCLKFVCLVFLLFYFLFVFHFDFKSFVSLRAAILLVLLPFFLRYSVAHLCVPACVCVCEL